MNKICLKDLENLYIFPRGLWIVINQLIIDSRGIEPRSYMWITGTSDVPTVCYRLEIIVPGTILSSFVPLNDIIVQ